MKRIITINLLAIALLFSSAFQNKASAQPSSDGDVNYQTFYDDLSPYGHWIDYPDYGYVWSPDAGADFRPYGSNGHWVYNDDYQWMWVSDYDWGWAPFHYGRWFYDPVYSWLWVPGYEWAPAWVAWRGGGDYYGWAPLRPGIEISLGFSMGDYYAPDDYWCFAPSRYITSPRIYDYCIDRRQNNNYIHNTIIINNYSRNRNVFINGPRRAEVERYTGGINSIGFRSSERPGRPEFRNNEVSIFRPQVRHDDNRRYQPRQVEGYNRSNPGRDDRVGRNDGRFDRNNGNFQRDNRSNNLPVRNEPVRPDNNDNRFRQPQRDNNNVDPRRIDDNRVNNNNNNNDPRRMNNNDPGRHFTPDNRRQDNNVNQPPRNNDSRFQRQPDKPVMPNPSNNDNRSRVNDNNQQGRHDFRNDNNNSFRQQSRQPDRQVQPRNFDHGNRSSGNNSNNNQGGGRRRRN